MRFSLQSSLLSLCLLAGALPLAAATFTVTNTALSGPGTLNDALNGIPYGSSNTIAFNIPGGGVHTILISTGFYVPNDTIIDGYTQPGAQPNSLTNGDNAVLLIELRASYQLPGTALNLGTGCVVRGLVINGFTSGAISASSGDVIQGNFLGTDPSGTVAEGNEYQGVFVTMYGTGGTVIVGGSSPADRNLISGNHAAGVEVSGSAGTTVIKGNLIGTDITGTRPLGNSVCGVVNYGAGAAIQVGGTNAGEGNIIAFNGVGVWNYPGLLGTVLGNSIFANQGLGITVGGIGAGAGVLPNGPGGFAPVITSTAITGGNTKVMGTLQAESNTLYRVEFFANTGLDNIGYGQGQQFLGFTTVTTGAGGNATFSATFPGSDQFISATATDPAGNTSEFSKDHVTSTNTFAAGDLLIALNNGLVQWRHSDGSLVSVIDPGLGWDVAPGGMAFDNSGNLYVTGQSNSTVLRYNPQGQSLGIFATNQDGYSEDISFDAAGNAYVAAWAAGNEVTEYDPTGKLLSEINPDPGLLGVYRFQLGADQATAYFDGSIDLIVSIYYLPFIEHYDLAAQKQLSVFYQTATYENAPSIYGFRLLADGGALLSSDLGLTRVSVNPAQPLEMAKVTQTYDAPGEDTWDPITVDADGRSFWAGTYSDSFIYKFDLATGAILSRIDTACIGGVASIAVFGGPVASTAGMFLGMAGGATALAGQSITNTLTLLNFHTNAITGVTVTDTLPAGATFSSASSSLGTFAPAGSKVTFTLGAVPAGTNVTMTVAFMPGGTGVVTNSAIAAATGPVAQSHSASAVTLVQPNPGALSVNTTSDSGAGSLRAAITAANAALGASAITFNISGTGPHIIQPLSPLPALTAPVTLDGYTQPGASPNTSLSGENATIAIALDGTGAGPLADGLVIGGGHSVVRGLAIYNFNGHGIAINHNDGNVITGNFIGTDATGTGSSHGNAKNGILISDSQNNTIGGALPALRNLISANDGSGIGITRYDSGNNSIQGNFIGTDRSGASLGNALDGVLVSASGVLIGGTNAGDGNVIDFNGGAGVSVFGTTAYNQYSTSVGQFTDGVGILGNSIFGNAQLGIDMSPAGVSFPNSQSTGPDGPLPAPVLSPIIPGSTSVSGSLNSFGGDTFRIELFASGSPDASGYGEGQTFLTAANATTDTNGVANFSIPVSSPLTNGEFITATAIELPNLDTSEFSVAVQVAPAANLSVFISASSDPAPARQNLIYTITVTNPGPGMATDVLVTNQTPEYTAFQSADSGGVTSYGNPPKVGWSLGTLPAGGSTSVHVIVSPTRIGAITASASVSALEANLAPAGTMASVTVNVTGAPRIVLVTNTADSGPGSLNAAIADVNANGYGLDTIQFDIPGGGVHTISPLFELPAITEPVVIDGYSQPGARPNTLTAGDNAVLLIQIQETNVSYGAALSLAAGNSTVRGLVINGTASEGIYINPTYGSPMQSNVVISGNFIGVSPGGTAAVSNTLSAGIDVDGNGELTGVVIGSASPADRNIISGNGGTTASTVSSGVWVNDADGVVIQGNYIGVDASGQTPLGNNGAGIALYSGDNSARIGGVNAGDGNIIAYNADIGVEIGGGTNNSVLENSIFDNGGMGLHLGFDYPSDPGSPTPNHPGGPISGANNFQNYPVLTSVNTSGGNTIVKGTLSSQGNTSYRVEFYSNARPSASFYGQGQTFLGAQTVTTDSGGNASFSFTFSGAADNISATATDPAGNTSEFSAVLLATSGGFQTGDLVVGSAGGLIQWRRNDGTPVALLNAGVTNNIQALAFDPSGRLIAAAGNELVWFDNQGKLSGVLATNVAARSFSFDATGDFYVAGGGYNSTPGSGPIWKFGPSGNLLGMFTAASDAAAPSYVDLAADQRTLYYTSTGTDVERYNVASLAQLSDFTTSLISAGIYTASDVRLLADGTVLVGGGNQSVARFDAAGNLLKTYTASTASGDLSVLALDPDGKSFWVSTYFEPSYLYRFDLDSSTNYTAFPTFIPSAAGGSTADGSFAIYGEPRVASPPAPVLTVTRIQQSVNVSWPAGFSGFTLQKTPTLSTPNWADLASATNSVTVPITNAQQFFRLIKC